MSARRPTRGPWLLAVALTVSLCGCGDESDVRGFRFSGHYPIRVVCTTGMVADMVRNVGGDRVTIDQLMGPDVDPHLYKASPRDVARLGRANMIFYSGWHLEGKMAEILRRFGQTRPSVAIAETISRQALLTDEEGQPDPHVWFDVSLWSQTAFAVADALGRFDPVHAEEYRANAAAYQSVLERLDQFCLEQLSQIPQERRVLVTAHDAFRYFGRRYGIEVRGIQGISTNSEAGVHEINELVEFIVRRRIKAVFVETSVAEKNVRALVEGCRARGHTVNIGGELYSDAMGPPGSGADTYEGMVRHNVRTIVQALK